MPGALGQANHHPVGMNKTTSHKDPVLAFSPTSKGVALTGQACSDRPDAGPTY